jgi:hypothetical protein
MKKAGQIFDRPDLIWIGSLGRAGAPPAGSSRRFADAGISIMRSGCDRNAPVIVFRAGPPGAAHIHSDALSLDVTALGVQRLADPGITSYAPDPLTDYYRSGPAHNMVLIDGKGPERINIPFAEKIRPAGSTFNTAAQGMVEIATGACSGPWNHIQGDLMLVRSVIFVRPDYWIVRDLVWGQGTHDVTTCWQFTPERVEIDIRTLAVRRLDAAGPRFDLIPLAGPHSLEVEQFTGAMTPPRGWVSRGGRDLPAPYFRYGLRGFLPVTIVWVLFPFSGRPTSGIQAVRTDQPPDQVIVEIAFPSGRRDVISMSNPGSDDIGSGGGRIHGKVVFKTFDRKHEGREIVLPC